MKQITVLVQDTPGALADICESFGRSGVNIKAISAEGLGEAGIIHIITEDLNTAKRAIEKEGMMYSINEIVTIKLVDKPGELGKVTRKLAQEGINIHYIYILNREKGATEIVLKVEDVEKAKSILDTFNL